MEELLEYRRDILSALIDIVPQLLRLAGDMPEAAWHIAVEKNGNTPHYILSRLVQLEYQVYAVYIPRIIEENVPLLPLIDVDAWMLVHYDPSVPVQSMVDQFARHRTQEVDRLHELPIQSWSRTARHPWWGVRTLQWWVERQLDESQRHLKALAAFQPF